MTTTTVSGEIREERVRYDFLGTLKAGWRAMRRHRQERRALVALSRLPPHVIRDMGCDPEQIYAALDGSWDEVDPGNFRNHLPRKERI
ncbi:hypothetical protein C5748_24380 [Phyllobacterium phragmitis]|uniref:YjiS-like domain-containing protein n=1 Tax=Phyllobacterium phragmitis TaxID=2670329 RepID=A0A2S9IK33_9HYPH|nr:DUF1127 domain-containing protein [Phyllobacterium phragmitis]PRD40890.1 hypothetical protein C5748_24380 [Phyllobacterium phragmitis]